MKDLAKFASMIYHFPSSLWVGFSWTRALNLASQKRHLEALDVINRMPARANRLISWRILRLQQNREIGNNNSAVNEAKELIPIIEENPRLSRDEKAYLLAYVKWMGASSYVKSNKADDSELARDFGMNWQEVNLARIPPHWKRRFPLRSHPQWSNEKDVRKAM